MNRIRMNNGFTLIELMIVLVIIGTLASLAFSSYGSATEKVRRSDATNALLKVAENQEKVYRINSAYSDVMADLGGEQSEKGHYLVSSVIANGGATYTLTATAVVGSIQDSDAACRLVTLNSVGQKAPAVCW